MSARAARARRGGSRCGRRTILTASSLALLVAQRLPAQALTVPELPWRTADTRSFRVLYPLEAEAWTRALLPRLDAVHDVVSALVGGSPAKRVTVIIEDPNNASNGFALPFLDAPRLFFWPTPPGPTSGVGDNAGWGGLLAVHEYAHIAHLARPSRNPTQRWLTHLSPAQFGPLALKSPRWVIEGYATYVEGRVTGAGRPNGVWRPAILRQWALEGVLPTYGELDGSGRYFGGAMAYLAGSAFLEWLSARGGDSSLVHLWRRMNARNDRGFDDAFAGVFGGPPSELYGRFTTEITASALATRDALAPLASTLDSGGLRMVQRLAWNTGSPALSPDGSKIAIALGSRDEPPRVVVWRTVDEPEDSAARARREREAALDTLDVPASKWRPSPKPSMAELWPRAGSPFIEPRWMPNGHELLVVRLSGTGSGLMRLDLWRWDAANGDVHRVTTDAGIRHADPWPDGLSAVADRCSGGVCDLVRVRLSDGAITVLRPGSPDEVWDRPRVSRDGRWIAVAVQRGGRWRSLLLDSAGTELRELGEADGANRYAPGFVGADSVALVSEAGGIPNIEMVPRAGGGGRALTRVSGAALAPDASTAGGSIYFLSLHARGLDLDRALPDSLSLGASPQLPRAPLVLPDRRHESLLDTTTVSPAQPGRPYGAGPREYRVLPSLVLAPEGFAVGAMFGSTDPVGRLTWLAQGLFGQRGSWQGASAGATWRGWNPSLSGELFYAVNEPSHQRGGFAGPTGLDVSWAGAAMSAAYHRQYLSRAWRLRGGAAVGVVDGGGYSHDDRWLATGELRAAYLQTPGRWVATERFSVLGQGGGTAGSGWARGLAQGALGVGRGGTRLEADAQYGLIDRRDITYEQFALGGTEPPLYDPTLLAQRIPLPALPAAVAVGRQLLLWRVSLVRSIWRPYFASGSASDDVGPWHRVVGLDAEFTATGYWLLRIPTVHVRAGIGYSFDPPVAHRTGIHFGVAYRP